MITIKEIKYKLDAINYNNYLYTVYHLKLLHNFLCFLALPALNKYSPFFSLKLTNSLLLPFNVTTFHILLPLTLK